jgi:hypothetical protein
MFRNLYEHATGTYNNIPQCWIPHRVGAVAGIAPTPPAAAVQHEEVGEMRLAPFEVSLLGDHLVDCTERSRCFPSKPWLRSQLMQRRDRNHNKDQSPYPICRDIALFIPILSPASDGPISCERYGEIVTTTDSSNMLQVSRDTALTISVVTPTYYLPFHCRCCSVIRATTDADYIAQHARC